MLITLNTRAMTREMIRELRVNRDSEVDACIRHLNRRGENVFIWGARGVGKTFLVRLIEAELQDEASILPVNVDVLGLPGFGRLNAATAFPEAVLLGICRTIWKDILNKPYSDLRGRLDLREGDIRFPSKLARTVETIYVHVMASQRKAHYEYSNSVGFSVGAKGETKETGWLEQEQPPILPFEFLEFCEELLGVLRDKGKNRVVVLCDEANLLPFEQQRDILGRYVDLFTSRSVQFLFVAGVHRWESVPPHIPEGFDLVLEVQGLQQDAVAELLGKMAQRSGGELESDAVDVAQKHLKGNPRLLLEALHLAIGDTAEVGRIVLPNMEEACKQVLEEEESRREMLGGRNESSSAHKPSA